MQLDCWLEDPWELLQKSYIVKDYYFENPSVFYMDPYYSKN